MNQQQQEQKSALEQFGVNLTCLLYTSNRDCQSWKARPSHRARRRDSSRLAGAFAPNQKQPGADW